MLRGVREDKKEGEGLDGRVRVCSFPLPLPELMAPLYHASHRKLQQISSRLSVAPGLGLACVEGQEVTKKDLRGFQLASSKRSKKKVSSRGQQGPGRSQGVSSPSSSSRSSGSKAAGFFGRFQSVFDAGDRSLEESGEPWLLFHRGTVCVLKQQAFVPEGEEGFRLPNKRGH